MHPALQGIEGRLIVLAKSEDADMRELATCVYNLLRVIEPLLHERDERANPPN